MNTRPVIRVVGCEEESVNGEYVLLYYYDSRPMYCKSDDEKFKIFYSGSSENRARSRWVVRRPKRSTSSKLKDLLNPLNWVKRNYYSDFRTKKLHYHATNDVPKTGWEQKLDNGRSQASSMRIEYLLE